MKSLKKILALAAVSTMLASSVNAQDCCYQECRSCSCWGPLIALGAIGIAAVIAVGVTHDRAHAEHAH